MATQAVIDLAGKQFIISEGDQISIDKHLSNKVGESVDLDQVLLLVNDDEPTLGAPLVDGAKVTVKVVALDKAPKVTSAKFKAKSRYRLNIGHRQPRTTLEVTKISSK